MKRKRVEVRRGVERKWHCQMSDDRRRASRKKAIQFSAE